MSCWKSICPTLFHGKTISVYTVLTLSFAEAFRVYLSYGMNLIPGDELLEQGVPYPIPWESSICIYWFDPFRHSSVVDL